METSLHRQLKRRYASRDSDTEVVIGNYRVDAVREDELIEVQCASLSAIREKSRELLRRHRLRIVKPVIERTRIRRLDRPGGKVVSRRMSPKRGGIVDVFEDLIYFTQVFPHPNLTIDVVTVQVEQTRVPFRGRRRRWQSDYRVVDVMLEEVLGQTEFRVPRDLLSVIPFPDRPASFNTADLASWIDRPRWFAQKVAYVLRKIGAVDARGRSRHGIIYT